MFCFMCNWQKNPEKKIPGFVLFVDLRFTSLFSPLKFPCLYLKDSRLLLQNL